MDSFLTKFIRNLSFRYIRRILPYYCYINVLVCRGLPQNVSVKAQRSISLSYPKSGMPIIVVARGGLTDVHGFALHLKVQHVVREVAGIVRINRFV